MFLALGRVCVDLGAWRTVEGPRLLVARGVADGELRSFAVLRMTTSGEQSEE